MFGYKFVSLDRFENMENTIDELRKEISEKEKCIFDMQRSIDYMSSVYNETNKKNDELFNNNLSLNEEIKKLNSIISTLKETISSFEKTNKTKKSKVDSTDKTTKRRRKVTKKNIE